MNQRELNQLREAFEPSLQEVLRSYFIVGIFADGDPENPNEPTLRCINSKGYDVDVLEDLILIEADAIKKRRNQRVGGSEPSGN